jgi:hypothetical protein
MGVENLGPGSRNLILARSEAGTYYAPGPQRLEAVDAVTGASVWTSPPLRGSVPPRSLRYLAAGAGGERRIAFGTTAGMYVTR